jgi:hypothetical protein
VNPGSAGVLYGGVKNIVLCDGGEVVAGIVGFVLAQRRSLRIASSIVSRADGSLRTAILLANGARCFWSARLRGAGAALTAARLSNEHRAIADLKRWVPDQDWTDVTFDWRRPSVATARVGLRWAMANRHRLERITKTLVRRYGPFHAFRSVELLFYYQRYVQLFAENRFRLAVLSSHSNPHGIALNLAARRFGVPVVLITHGMPIVPVARLDYDLAVMECEASAETYRRAGCRIGRVIVKSRRAEFMRMRPDPPVEPLTVGVFLSKDPTAHTFGELVRTLLANGRVERIIIRPHPVNLWWGLRAAVESFHDDRVSLSATMSVVEDLRACDIVVAANSTVHIEALLAGKPSCYARGLDHAPFDVQSFVRDGLVYDLVDWPRLDPIAVWRFYMRPEWPAVLRRYADIDHDEADVACRIRAAIQDLSIERAA